MVEEALEVDTDLDYRFELAIQLGKFETAKDIALVAKSKSKWKQLGELAMSAGMLDMAEDCLKHANIFIGLLLLYPSLGDAKEIAKLASLAKENGKNNVAFSCLFMLGKLEDCLQLLIARLLIHICFGCYLGGSSLITDGIYLFDGFTRLLTTTKESSKYGNKECIREPPSTCS